MAKFVLSHDAQDIDDTIDEVQAARGSEASLSARLAEIVGDFEADQQRQDTETSTKVTMQQVYGDAVSIPANSDLNSYTTSGIYFALVANVPTIANTPYTLTGFRIVVEKNTLDGKAVFQTLYPTSRTHLEFYRRVYEGGSWSPWYKFEGTQVASAQSPASLMQAGRIDAELSDAQEVTENDT
jgi:hypothetical protein